VMGDNGEKTRLKCGLGRENEGDVKKKRGRANEHCQTRTQGRKDNGGPRGSDSSKDIHRVRPTEYVSKNPLKGKKKERRLKHSHDQLRKKKRRAENVK